MRISRLVLHAVGILWFAHAQLCAAQTLPISVNSLKPFTTDGCSMWVDGTPKQPYLWRHCCVAHDKAYWLGGTEAQRKTSDEQLRACIIDTGNKPMADYLYFSVRWGGAPLWLTPYRWGFGWDYLEHGRVGFGKVRGYQALTEADLVLLRPRILEADQIIAADALKHPRVIAK